MNTSRPLALKDLLPLIRDAVRDCGEGFLTDSEEDTQVLCPCGDLHYTKVYVIMGDDEDSITFRGLLCPTCIAPR